jgi:hypothetical protein
MNKQRPAGKTGKRKTPLVASIERLISRPADHVGMRVAEFLNSSEKEGKTRIVKLLGLLRDLERVPPSDLQDVHTEVIYEGHRSATVEILEPHQSIQEIGYLLSRYTLHPSIAVRGPNEIVFTKVAANFESDAANALTELFKVKKLHLLGTCRSCREWFYARKEDQEFCGSKCRAEHGRETPRGQAIHRAESKLNYWGKQRGLWSEAISKLKSEMASAKPQRRREIESDLWDAEARHQKALKRMAEVSKELSRAQQMTMGDIT